MGIIDVDIGNVGRRNEFNDGGEVTNTAMD